jgi:DNA repair protein RecO (recombination protein O)
VRAALQSGFVLHRRPYRETSLLVDVFSAAYGRVSLIAKGVRSHRSNSRALLQPFMPLLFSWQGKTELMSLTMVEAEGLPINLKGECLLAAFYLNELLMYLLPKQDPHPNLYTTYRNTLVELQAPILKEAVLRLFEKRLLEEMGYGLQLPREFTPDNYYRYYPEQGFELCSNQLEMSMTVFSGKSLLALAREELSNDEVLKDVKRLMRLAYKPLLAGKELKSRELFV